jgi:hypothetical protein
MPSYLASEPACKRKAADDRRLKLAVRDDQMFNDWTSDDGISNFDGFCCNASDFVTDSADVRHGTLSNETVFALKHTVATFIELLHFYLVHDIGVSYVLTGKFQTVARNSDSVNIVNCRVLTITYSVQELKESEKQLKIVMGCCIKRQRPTHRYP